MYYIVIYSTYINTVRIWNRGILLLEIDDLSYTKLT